VNKILKDDELLTVEILEQSASENASRQSSQFNSIEKTEENSTPQVMKRPPVPTVNAIAASVDVSSDEDEIVERKSEERQQVLSGKRPSCVSALRGSKGALPSPLGSAHSFDLQVANWRMEKLEVDSKSGSEEEFFDCLGETNFQLKFWTFSTK
jgi:hypothetical protein